MNVPDNYDMWEAHESELEAERSKYPVAPTAESRLRTKFFSM